MYREGKRRAQGCKNFQPSYFICFLKASSPSQCEHHMSNPLTCHTSLLFRAYSCGSAAVMKRQFTRLAVATGLWYGLTGVFLFVEESSGICNVTKFLNKAECLAGGFR